MHTHTHKIEYHTLSHNPHILYTHSPNVTHTHTDNVSNVRLVFELYVGILLHFSIPL